MVPRNVRGNALPQLVILGLIQKIFTLPFHFYLTFLTENTSVVTADFFKINPSLFIP